MRLDIDSNQQYSEMLNGGLSTGLFDHLLLPWTALMAAYLQQIWQLFKF
jgi:hypothetical protein